MNHAEARVLFKKATIERVAIHQELDDILRKMRPLTKGAGLPADVLAMIRRFARFEHDYELLKRDAAGGAFQCSECGRESDDPAAKCPGCGTEMAVENNDGAPPAALTGAPAPAEDDDLAPPRKSGGRLDGRPIFNTRKRRARLL